MSLALRHSMEGRQESGVFICEGQEFPGYKTTEDNLVAIEISGYWHYFRQQGNENKFLLVGSSEEFMSS